MVPKKVIGISTMFVLVFLLMVSMVGCTDDSSSGDDDDDGGIAADDDDDDYSGDDSNWGDDDDSFSSDDDDYYGDDDSHGGPDDDDSCDDDYDDDVTDDDDASVDDDDETDDDDEVEDPYECPETTDNTLLFLSADDSNSQASPIVVRDIIESGGIVPAHAVRTYEFTNYYQIEYDYPQYGELKILPQMRSKGVGDFGTELVLQIGAQSYQVNAANQRPKNIVLSLDTSGSMSGTPIALLKEVCKAIAKQLRAGDILSMVEWSSSQTVVLDSHVVTGPNDPAVLSAIVGLHSGGSTDLHGGLVRAYELAENNYGADKLNRVVLISDGGANTGVTDINIIAQAADDSEGQGIYMVGVGVGEAGYYYNDDLMDAVTDAGKGAYVFVDSANEAWKQFDDRFQENMEVAALDVRVSLEMPYYLLMKEFHGEEYSENPDEVEPQHLGPNDAMVFHQILVVCDEDLLDTSDLITVRAFYIDPFSLAEKNDERTMSIADMLAAEAPQLTKGDAVVAYAESLKQIYDLRYTDPDQALQICVETRQMVEQAADELGDTELEDITALLQQYEVTLGGKL